MSICVFAQISMRVRESRGVEGKPSPAVRSISNPAPAESRIISLLPRGKPAGSRDNSAGWEPVQASSSHPYERSLGVIIP